MDPKIQSTTPALSWRSFSLAFPGCMMILSPTPRRLKTHMRDLASTSLTWNWTIRTARRRVNPWTSFWIWISALIQRVFMVWISSIWLGTSLFQLFQLDGYQYILMLNQRQTLGIVFGCLQWMVAAAVTMLKNGFKSFWNITGRPPHILKPCVHYWCHIYIYMCVFHVQLIWNSNMALCITVCRPPPLLEILAQMYKVPTWYSFGIAK